MCGHRRPTTPGGTTAGGGAVALAALGLLAALAGVGAGACSLEEQRARRALGSEDPAVRAAALRVLGRRRAVDALDEAAALMRDGSARVRRAAVAAVGALGPRGHVPALIDRLRDPDLQVRLAAARVLGDSGAPGAARAVLPLLRDAAEVVRGAARLALVSLGVSPVEQQRRLAELMRSERLRGLGDADPGVRAEAARDLGASGAPEALGPLLRALDDRDAEVSAEAAAAAGRLGGLRATRALTARARASSVNSRVAAARGLGRAALATPEAAPLGPLAALAKDGETAVRVALWDALAGSDTAPLAKSPICEQLGAPDAAANAADLRATVCGALLAAERRVADAASRVVARCALRCAEQVAALQARGEAATARPVRHVLLHRLARVGRGEAVTAALVRHARSEVAALRGATERWVSPTGWAAVDGTPPVAQAALPSRPPRSRADRLAWLLARFPEVRGGDAAEDPLLPPDVRSADVAALIADLGGRAGAYAWLAELATDEVAPAALRAAALSALGDRGHAADAAAEAAAAAAVRAGLGSERSELRQAALLSCAVAPQRGEEVALHALAGADFELRTAAAICLQRLRGTSAVAALLAALAREPQLAVIEALAAIGDHRATAPIARLLHEDHAELRYDEREVIVGALGQLGDGAAAGELERELGHPSWRVRWAAARAKPGAFRARSHTPLQACAHDFFAVVRAACRRQLAGLKEEPR